MNNRPRLDALTALRFFAAAHVFLFHLEAAKLLVAPAFARQLAGIGYVGVNFFFVLSGFILTWAHAGTPPGTGQYLRARFFRIYPAYFVSLCLAAPVFIYVCFYTTMPLEQSHIAVMKDHALLFVGLAVLLLQAWVPAAALSVNPVAWSLSVEVCFYLLFPSALRRLSAVGRTGLITAIVALGALSVALALAYVQWAPDGVAITNPDMNNLPWLNVLRFNPLLRLPEFLMGIGGAQLLLRHPLPARFATPLVVGGVLLVTAAALLSNRIAYPVLHNGLLSLPFLAIIYGVAQRPTWTTILEWRVFRMLGETSYAFFLTHGMVIVLWFVRDGAVAKQATVVDIIVCFLLAQALAMLVYYTVEQPLRRRFARSGARPPQPLRGPVKS